MYSRAWLSVVKLLNVYNGTEPIHKYIVDDESQFLHCWGKKLQT